MGYGNTDSDDRPRHIRLADQELAKGGRLVINHRKGHASILRDGIKNRLTIEQGEEAKGALEDEFGDQVSVIEWEQLTTSEVLERWPGLEEHYSDARQSLYDRGYSGKLARSKDGGRVLWHIDEAFREWIDSLGIDQEKETEAEEASTDEAEESPKGLASRRTDGAEEPEEHIELEGGDGSAETVASWPETNGSAPEALESTSGAKPDRPIERLLEQLRFAHLEYVRTLHEGGDLEAAQEAVEETTSLIRERLQEITGVVVMTEHSAGLSAGEQSEVRSPRVDGVLSRITGDERLETGHDLLRSEAECAKKA